MYVYVYVYIYICVYIYIYLNYIHLSLDVNVLQLLSTYSQLKGSQNLHQLSNTNWCIELLIS